MAVTVIYLPENIIIGVIGAVSANPAGKKVYHEVYDFRHYRYVLR